MAERSAEIQLLNREFPLNRERVVVSAKMGTPDETNDTPLGTTRLTEEVHHTFKQIMDEGWIISFSPELARHGYPSYDPDTFARFQTAALDLAILYGRKEIIDLILSGGKISG